tara:strand:- start:534 stop:1700 length:1167 start_codon:yes stop_codon:yes gene_type:complete
MERRDFINFAATTALFTMSPFSSFAKANSKNLILIELQGANDGLNTVIPLKDNGYYKLRPNIAIPKKDILSVDANYGLHFSLNGVAKLCEAGDCSIVQNLGYPNPILSHFRSIELWERGGDGKKNGREGWLNKTLEALADRSILDAKAMNLDNGGTIFAGGTDGYLGPNAIGYRPIEAESRDTTVPLPNNINMGLLGNLQKMRVENEIKIARLQEKMARAKRSIFVGRGELGSQLSKVCQLIMAGVDIPVFKVSIGSFDTHIEQFWKHRSLLRDLDKSISDTVRILKDVGVWDDTIIMTYSEFGRRAKENGSRGTDHGMAAPHFVLGGKISGAVYGEENVLTSVADSNLKFSIDYRSLYNEILSKHFGFPENQFSNYRDQALKGLFMA